MEMTEEQRGIVAWSYEKRLAEPEVDQEVWFPVEPALVPHAHGLAEKGWLDRRTRPELAWRLSDQGLSALRINAMRRTDPADLN